MTSPLLSVIIPTLDEAANLPSILADLRAQQGIGLEIIVADGMNGAGDAGQGAADECRGLGSQRWLPAFSACRFKTHRCLYAA